jgi:hypothetical protein
MRKGPLLSLGVLVGMAFSPATAGSPWGRGGCHNCLCWPKFVFPCVDGSGCAADGFVPGPGPRPLWYGWGATRYVDYNQGPPHWVAPAHPTHGPHGPEPVLQPVPSTPPADSSGTATEGTDRK